MGNRIGRKRCAIEERFTRPQRLARQPSNVDYKRLRKLILSEKLAPCYDGVEDSNPDLEDCPICFFYYPSLNRSKCCKKGICTECFLQMNPSNATHSAHCPFCKTPSYGVEYHGAKTQEEKGLEQAEEQKVIEAKIRMQLQESENTNQVILSNRNLSPVDGQSLISSSTDLPTDGGQDLGDVELSLVGGGIEITESPLNSWSERHEEFGIDLEEIMIMEAILQSLKNPTGQLCSGSSGITVPQSETGGSNQSRSFCTLPGQEEVSSDSVPDGIAVAIARLAEHNIHRSGTWTTDDNDRTVPIQDENFTEEENCRLSNASCDMKMIEAGSSMDAESDENESESGCLTSCSSTADETWESYSACLLKESQCSEDGSMLDEDLGTNEEAIDVDSSCFSSIHTVSDISCGSSNSYNIVGSSNC